ncbi:MAG: hypothetical protein ACYC4S_13965 [Rhodoferax sp.]
MKQKTVFLVGSWQALGVFGSASFAQPPVDFGKNECMASCASGHGVSGKGDGAS